MLCCCPVSASFGCREQKHNSVLQFKSQGELSDQLPARADCRPRFPGIGGDAGETQVMIRNFAETVLRASCDEAHAQ